MTSLRRRLLFGAALWTVGLVVAAIILMTFVMLAHPGYAPRMHGVAYRHALPYGALALLAMGGGIWSIRAGIAPINQLRARLAEVRGGRADRLEGTYPAEVQPLVDDLNALLEQRERTVARALARAGDLAHGLKTPLALLLQDAERARAAGHVELAEGVAGLVERMRRQTDYHLAQARAAASGARSGAACAVGQSVDGLVRALGRLHADRHITIESRVAADVAVACQREDLDEMLGNVLDNACKWARGRVAVSVAAAADRVAIDVDDDGAGLAALLRDAVLQRGVRADEAAPGSGLGLAIVRDLAELYGGAIELDESPLGGLRARLTLPRASHRG